MKPLRALITILILTIFLTSPAQAAEPVGREKPASLEIIRIAIPPSVLKGGLPSWMSRHLSDVLNGYVNEKKGFLAVEPPAFDSMGILEGRPGRSDLEQLKKLGIRFLVASQLTPDSIKVAVLDSSTGKVNFYEVATSEPLAFTEMLKLLEALPELGLPLTLKRADIRAFSYRGVDSRRDYLKALEIYHKGGDPVSAMGELKKSLKLDPKNRHARELKARIYTIAGKFSDASAIYRGILKEDSRSLPALLGEGLVLAAQSQSGKAAVWFEEALQRRPGNILLMYNRAYCLERSGDPGGAERVYIDILKMDPGNHVARYNLGVLYYSWGLYPRAFTLFEKLEQDNPRQPLYAYLCASALLGEGRVDKARERLLSLSRRGDFKEVYNDLGLLERARSDGKKAREFFKKALKVDPKYLPALNNLGIQYLEAKDYPAARKVFESALSQNPSYPEALYNLGVLEMERKNYSRAWVYFSRVYQQDPSLYQAAVNLGICELKSGNVDQALKTLKALEKTHPDSPLLLYNLGVITRMAGEPARALDYFQQVLTISPDHPDALLNASSILVVSGEYKKARLLLDRAMELVPDNPLTWFNMGLLEYLSGNGKQAIRYFSKTLKINPDNNRARRFMVRAMLIEGMFLPARKQLDVLLAKAPKDYLSRYLLAVYYQRTGQPGKAAGVLEEMTGDSRYYLQGYYYLARLYFDMGEFVKSADKYRMLIKLEPDDVNHRLGLARANYRAGRMEQAAAAAREAIRLAPKNVAGYHYLGVVLIDQGKFDLAAGVYRKVLELAPGNANYQVNLALCLAYSNQGVQARQIAEELARDNPENPAISYVVAAVYAVTGDRAGMLKYLKAAVKLDPKLKARAAGDEDFRKFRKDPDFRKVVEGI